ncbi:EF-hand domain-containing protein [Ruegeria sediminis]|uniref:EF-hand domain-containing protein n=1 Tax=Ruegeria sediminis TaxID=2583820 RepID=A0ABY2X0C5_9RHOB|nr:EF-hand domain-containing protein [Ruegeria sediminis]TMV08695.1 EF-hand domain-containing protein [Ruegeria sediminis]
MKPQHLALIAAITAGLPSLALAQSAADANGDGMLTIEELQAVIPDLEAEQFASMDVNGDGSLDQDEVAAAQEAGLLPATDG